ncbi:MAG: LITAF-like zinc ribbon domain-containing protein [Pyrinomonadaceae bacterium]
MTLQQQPVNDPGFDYSAPRAYAWKTDEFQTKNEPRKGKDTGYVDKNTGQIDHLNSNYRPAPLAYQQPGYLAQPFRCPTCSSQMMPRIERRISTGGWITFAVLLVAFFPLFWIGLLIKENVPVCQTCDSKLALGPHR